jgi:hypothetical protein
MFVYAIDGKDLALGHVDHEDLRLAEIGRGVQEGGRSGGVVPSRMDTTDDQYGRLYGFQNAPCRHQNRSLRNETSRTPFACSLSRRHRSQQEGGWPIACLLPLPG